MFLDASLIPQPHGGLLVEWDLDGVALTFAQTTDDKGTIATRTYGKCRDQSKLPDPPAHFEASNQWQAHTVKLCESAPWFRWTIKTKTASKLGSGTDADIQAALSCGGKPVTGQLKLTCPTLTPCFERWAGSRLGAAGVTPAHACRGMVGSA